MFRSPPPPSGRTATSELNDPCCDDTLVSPGGPYTGRRLRETADRCLLSQEYAGPVRVLALTPVATHGSYLRIQSRQVYSRMQLAGVSVT